MEVRRARITSLAARYHVPAVYATSSWARLGMTLGDPLEKDRKCARDVLDPLSFHGCRRKAREIDRVPGSAQPLLHHQALHSWRAWAISLRPILLAFLCLAVLA
jgi:hypothetical protein